jgi:hypothetical protein
MLSPITYPNDKPFTCFVLFPLSIIQHAFRISSGTADGGYRPFIGAIVSPTPADGTTTMHPALSVLSQVHFLAMDDHSPRNLYMFRKNVVTCRRLPLAQIAQLFAFYREQKELATNMLERFALDVNRSLLDKLFISLATMIFAGERDKNLLWEQLKSLCAHGVSPRLLSRLDASSAPIWFALRAPNSATDVDVDADTDALGDADMMDLFDVGL